MQSCKAQYLDMEKMLAGDYNLTLSGHDASLAARKHRKKIIQEEKVCACCLSSAAYTRSVRLHSSCHSLLVRWHLIDHRLHNTFQNVRVSSVCLEQYCFIERVLYSLCLLVHC